MPLRHAARLFRPPPADVGWPAYLWLLFLVPFLVRPLTARAGPVETAASAAFLLGFLWSYFRAYHAPTRERLSHVAFQALGGLLFLATNGAAGVFFLYAAGAAGRLEPERLAWRTLLVVTAVGLAGAWLAGVRLEWLVSVAIGAPLIGAANLHEARGHRATAALRAATARNAELAATAERERIARDLHDALGHTLTLVVLKAQVARRLAAAGAREADGGPLLQELTELEAAARGALTEVRQAVRGYRATLDDALRSARALLETAGIDVAVEVALGDADAARDAVLAAAIRELTTNVARHAGARHCAIVVREDARSTHLTVTDDGRGGAVAAGHGLRGLAERVAALDGELRIASGGTTLHDPAAVRRGAGLAVVVRLPRVRAGDAGVNAPRTVADRAPHERSPVPATVTDRDAPPAGQHAVGAPALGAEVA